MLTQDAIDAAKTKGTNGMEAARLIVDFNVRSPLHFFGFIVVCHEILI